MPASSTSQLQWSHASSRVETRDQSRLRPQRSASMEPRVFTRGNSFIPSPFRHRQSCFNGATRLHAWKLTRRRQSAQRAHRFNGATRLHAWKRIAVRMPAATKFASMEPRVFTRGNTAQTARGLRRQSCFNGATRLHAWKRAEPGADDPPRASFNGATRLHAWKQTYGRISGSVVLSLQWSHASSRVETSCSFR